ncbi:protein kinase [Sphaerisporangium sp. TRM90804]|uniref:protein kinase domain-containing protein n=1 Tax=Sphaerisporangium sp. TRM90804 TaxID=3031113 RepID=UPI002449FD69|nr:protein kinase [Sphaerisporangium sp. TRM90804]MDH2429704.1 protein kinase [Sphaerisporangium sp. TRM90804]
MNNLSPGDPPQIGRYRLLGRLGRGGMGTVYLGQDGTGQRVAVKVINPEYSQHEQFRTRFRREAQAAGRVRRFCTAAVLDADLDGDQLYVVTEFVDGPNLDEAVRASGPLRGSSLDALAVGVATALTAIHSAGVIHRDLKPSNVLLSPVGPRVIDFGIARALDTLGGITGTGELMGTPRYMAPEALRGEPVSPACDVFSWGCLVAFAASGRTPFGGDSLPSIVYQVLSAEPSLEGMEPSLHALVAATLRKDPAHRPTAQQILDQMVGRTTPERAEHSVAEAWRHAPPTLHGPTIPGQAPTPYDSPTTAPGAHGPAPTAHGTPPTLYGPPTTVPGTHGQAPTAHGNAPTLYGPPTAAPGARGAAPTAHGSARTLYGPPTGATGTAPTGHGTPPTLYGPPTGAHGAAPTAHGAPPTLPASGAASHGQGTVPPGPGGGPVPPSGDRPAPRTGAKRVRLIAIGVAAAVALLGARVLLAPPGPPTDLGFLYRVDFNESGTGWSGDYTGEQYGKYGYAPGGYYAVDVDDEGSERVEKAPIPFVAKQPATPDPSATPTPTTPGHLLVSVTTTVRAFKGPGEYGLYCRADEEYRQSRYEFLLTPQGQARIRRLTKGAGGDLTAAVPVDDLEKGTPARMQVECAQTADGVQLTMWVNGEQVQSYLDASGLPNGDVGLLTRVPEKSGALLKTSFDDFTVQGTAPNRTG